MNVEEIKIDGRKIGEGKHCFIIADAGINHDGNFNLAKKLIDAAKEAGADAVKFQTFKSEKIATPSAEQAKYQAENMGRKEFQCEMLKRLELSYDDFRKLKKYCDERDVIFLSTPHSCWEDVDLVADLCLAIKIGSGDLTNLPILKYIAEKKLPILLSTGMGTLEEVKEAVNLILPINKKLVLLHCTTNYPTPMNEVNLKAMGTMKNEFNLLTGYSDHTSGIEAALAAVILGACVIEKHLTLDRNKEGPDHKASLEPDELKNMVYKIREIEKRLKSGEKSKDIVKELNVEQALGDGEKKPMPSEYKTMKVVRKSIVAAKDIKKGSVLTEDVLIIKRPGTGLEPKYYWDILGKRVKKDIKKDQMINSNDLI